MRGSKRNNHATPVLVPLGKGFIGSPPRKLENMERHNDGKALHLDVHPSVSDFIGRTFFNKCWQRNHTAIPLLGGGNRVALNPRVKQHSELIQINGSRGLLPCPAPVRGASPVPHKLSVTA